MLCRVLCCCAFRFVSSCLVLVLFWVVMHGGAGQVMLGWFRCLKPAPMNLAHPAGRTQGIPFMQLGPSQGGRPHHSPHGGPCLRWAVPWLEEQTSLKPWQIKIEKFMPVTDDFTRGDGLPRPGTEVALRLKAQLPEEEVFLGGVYGVYKVAV